LVKRAEVKDMIAFLYRMVQVELSGLDFCCVINQKSQESRRVRAFAKKRGMLQGKRTFSVVNQIKKEIYIY